MPDKETADLRRELSAEREHLGTAVDDLRAEVDELKRKLPRVAATVLAVGLVAELLRRRLFR
ncbi:MAG: hypothetical protein ACM3QU_01000 [Verrucomicrobiota bacterium]